MEEMEKNYFDLFCFEIWAYWNYVVDEI